MSDNKKGIVDGDYVRITNPDDRTKALQRPGWSGFFERKLRDGDVIRVEDVSSSYIYYIDGDGDRQGICNTYVEKHFGAVPRNIPLATLNTVLLTGSGALVFEYVKGFKSMQNVINHSVFTDPLVWKSGATLIAACCYFLIANGGLITIKNFGSALAQYGERRRRVKEAKQTSIQKATQYARDVAKWQFDEDCRQHREKISLAGDVLNYDRRVTEQKDERLIKLIEEALKPLVTGMQALTSQTIQPITMDWGSGRSFVQAKFARVLTNTSEASHPNRTRKLIPGDIVQIAGDEGDYWKFNLNDSSHQSIRKSDVMVL